MPISGDVWLDPNGSRFSLPKDSCVGETGGPEPTQVTTISKGGSKAKAPGRLAPSGGDPYAGGKSTKPGWRNPTVGYDGP
jgi:hypothetical protein